MNIQGANQKYKPTKSLENWKQTTRWKRKEIDRMYQQPCCIRFKHSVKICMKRLFKLDCLPWFVYYICMLFTGTSPRKHLFVRHSWVQVDIETLANKDACSHVILRKVFYITNFHTSCLKLIKKKKKKLDIWWIDTWKICIP